MLHWILRCAHVINGTLSFLSVNVLQGFALEKLIASRAKRTDEAERVVAKVQIWSDHAELLHMVKLAMHY